MPIIIALLASLGSIFGLAGIGYVGSPAPEENPEAATPEPGENYIRVFTNYTQAFFEYVETGFIILAGWLGNLSFQEIIDSFDEAIPFIGRSIERTKSRFRTVLWIVVLCALAIFAGFALNETWLSQSGVALLVFPLFFCFLAITSIVPVIGSDDGNAVRRFKEVMGGLKDGFGVIIMILVSLAMIQWGIGDLGWNWVSYALWGSTLFAIGYFVLSRLLKRTGFAGIKILFVVATACLVIGIVSRAAKTEVDNYKAKYGLFRKDLQVETDMNNAKYGVSLVKVLTPVGNYTTPPCKGKCAVEGETVVTPTKVIDPATRLQAVTSPGTYRRINNVNYRYGGDTFILISNINEDGTVVGQPTWLIPLNTEKVRLIGKEGDTPPPPPNVPLVVVPPSVTISPDGMTCELVVPAQVSGGVPCIDNAGNKLEVKPSDILTITASGLVDIGRGKVGPNGEGGYRDTTVDSPFIKNVGGLEGWFGDRKSFDDRVLVGESFSDTGHTGVPTLRVIESLLGYRDRNVGAFQVTVTKTSTSITSNKGDLLARR